MLEYTSYTKDSPPRYRLGQILSDTRGSFSAFLREWEMDKQSGSSFRLSNATCLLVTYLIKIHKTRTL